MPTILCLEKIVASGQSSFPIFIGFLAAKEILEVAEAPSFTKATTNQQIAIVFKKKIFRQVAKQ